MQRDAVVRVCKLDLSQSPNLLAFQARITARPAVQRAIRREELTTARILCQSDLS